MKAAFFYAIALAVSAFAAPHVAENQVERDLEIIEKRTINNPKDLVSALEVAVSAVVDLTVAIDTSVGKIGTGKGQISADTGAIIAESGLKSINLVLTGLSTKIKTAGHIKGSSKAQVTVVLNLMVKLVTKFIACAKKLVVAVGLRAEIKSLLKISFTTLADIVSRVCGLVPSIVSNLVKNCTSAIVGASTSALKPVLGKAFSSVAGFTTCAKLHIS